MKKLLAILFFITASTMLSTASDFTLNRGSVEQNGFYVTIPFETRNDLLIIEIYVNGLKKKFLLDTGAPTAISESLQKQLKFKKIARIQAEDINGNEKPFNTVMVNEIGVDGMKVIDIPALVIDDNNPIFTHLGIDGIIGSNFLRNMIVRISVKDEKIILTDNIEYLNLKDAYAEYMHTDKDVQSSPVIKVRLGEGITEELLFDTGFSGFYDISNRQFSTFGKHEDISVVGEEKSKAMYGMIGVEQNTDKLKVLIPQYNVGGFTFHNVVAYTSSDDNSKIGAKFLRTADVTLDYINNKFYLQPYSIAGYDFDNFCCMDAYYCKND